MGQGYHTAKMILLTQGVSKGGLGLDGTMVQNGPRTAHQQRVRTSFLEISTLPIFGKHICPRRTSILPQHPFTLYHPVSSESQGKGQRARDGGNIPSPGTRAWKRQKHR